MAAGTAGHGDGAAGGEQPPLPFDDAPGRDVDGGVGAPVDYVLTARARRVVAPASLPDLEVLPGRDGAGDGHDDGLGDDDEGFDPHDTRPARARALHRAGHPVDETAAMLEVDPQLVRAWCRDMPAVPARRRDAGAPAAATSVPVATPSDATVARATAAFETRNDDGGAAFLAGLGYVTGRASISAHAITVRAEDDAAAAAALAWLRDHLDVEDARVRVVLDLPAGRPRDLATHRWATALDLPADRFTASTSADRGDDERAIVRVADPAAAATLDVWRRLLLDRLCARPGHDPKG